MDNNFTIEEKLQIADMYRDNYTIDKIMEIMNYEEHYIREVLKEYELDRVYNTFSEELNNRIIELHKQKKLHKEISYDCLVSGYGINKILDKNKIPRMTYEERNRRYFRNSYYFDEIDTANKAYFLGLLWADGNNNTSHNQINISLQIDDKYLLDKFKKELDYEGEVKIYDYEHKKNPKHKIIVKLSIEDAHMSKVLEQYGMVSNKSLILNFPSCIPNEFIRDFIRGYFDGDGCVRYDEKYQKGQTQTVGTLEVCTQISYYMSEKEIRHHIRNPKQSKGKNTYIITTSATKSSYLFLSWLYDNSEIKMERKYNRYLRIREKYYQINAA